MKQETQKKSFTKIESEFDEDCNFNGNLKKIIKGNQNSFYECVCDEGFRGDNCEISEHIYNIV